MQTQIIMPPRRAVRGRLARRNVEEQYTTEDLENFIEELKKVFDVMHVADTERVELAAYQIKNVARTWFDQWKGESLSVHKYGLKFTQLSRYAPEMVNDMRSRMSLFVAGLARLSRKEGQTIMLIGDMDISRLMVYVQQVEEKKLKDREEFKNKKVKT
ncbi:uncharacterized protein LOC125873722 [Solanum stenotomum]|uniref:uncharacterized protein LOC125873722 n=1 Tax=Solanum stenotomum TaxID=172797 RepID=UPI0020D077B9|nr:uncharacterized protein LOC125873722 [Solanum stenotomum]